MDSKEIAVERRMGEGFLSGRWRGFGRVMLACLGVALFVGRAFGAAEPRTDGETYTVSAIQFVLPSGVADFPTEADLDRLQIVLADAPGGKAVPQSLEQEYRQTELRETFNEKSPYVAWPPVPESVVAIGDIGKGGRGCISSQRIVGIGKRDCPGAE